MKKGLCKAIAKSIKRTEAKSVILADLEATEQVLLYIIDNGTHKESKYAQFLCNRLQTVLDKDDTIYVIKKKTSLNQDKRK